MMHYQIVHYAHFNDGTGWANASVEYARALNIAIKNYNEENKGKSRCSLQLFSCKLNQSNIPIPDDLAHLEVKKVQLDPTAFTICLQQTLPHFMGYLDGFKLNVGALVCETDFKYSDWPEYLNMMDTVVVPSESNYDNVFRSGVLENKLYKIEYPFNPADVVKYNSIKKSESIHPLLDGNYVFYTISEYSKRKNFGALVRAFLAEFDPAEPVSLVIKMSGDKEALTKEIEEIKAGMKLYQDRAAYQPIVLISERLTDDRLIQLHKDFDCFVNVSHAEGWSLPTFQATMFGKQVLSVTSGGVHEFVESEGLISAQKEGCIGATDTLPFLYTAREEWRNVNLPSLQYKMRQAYTIRSKFKSNPPSLLKHYTYEKIGREFLDILGVEPCSKSPM